MDGVSDRLDVGRFVSDLVERKTVQMLIGGRLRPTIRQLIVRIRRRR